MAHINENYLKLQASYLFKEISNRVSAYQERNADRRIIKLGIGDVTEPLPFACREAFHRAVDELGLQETFRGYDDSPGYLFLRDAIVAEDFAAHNAPIAADEIFLSDGSKSDTANIQEIFSTESRVAIPDPVYPVYLDTNVMAGRTGKYAEGRYERITYLDSTPTNDYIPHIPETPVDLIYLCFPNNPTGVSATREQLEKWVDYARSHGAIIFFDAAYEAYIRDESIPHSIYEIPGARETAIEFRSLSKSAGFTGVRCAYTVIPKDLMALDKSGSKRSLHALWSRRYSTKFNGLSYPVQRAAAAAYSIEGKVQVQALTDFYLGNAKLIREAVKKLSYRCVGGDNSPYIWIQTNIDSWKFFDLLLEEAGVVTTPGAGFGKCGEGHIRISAFNSRENVEEAIDRISQVLR